MVVPPPVRLLRAAVLALMLTVPAAACADLSDVTRKLDEIRRENGIAAAGFLVVDRKRILALEALGVRNHDTGLPFDVDDLVRIGSITKAVNGVLTMRLVGRSVVTLDDRVAAVLDPPPYENPWAESHPVRVAHLLEHTAGLRDLTKREFDFNDPVTLDRTRNARRVRCRRYGCRKISDPATPRRSRLHEA